MVTLKRYVLRGTKLSFQGPRMQVTKFATKQELLGTFSRRSLQNV